MTFIYVDILQLWLGGVAVLCVILSILVCCGISSIFGLPYGPLHNILPFLVLGKYSTIPLAYFVNKYSITHYCCR